MVYSWQLKASYLRDWVFVHTIPSAWSDLPVHTPFKSCFPSNPGSLPQAWWMASDSASPKQVACLMSEFFACPSFFLTRSRVSICTGHHILHPHTHHPMAISFPLGDLVFIISTPGQPLPINWRCLKRGELYLPWLSSLQGTDFVLLTSSLIHKQLY